jgi:hypothetical protein
MKVFSGLDFYIAVFFQINLLMLHELMKIVKVEIRESRKRFGTRNWRLRIFGTGRRERRATVSSGKNKCAVSAHLRVDSTLVTLEYVIILSNYPEIHLDKSDEE